MSGGNVVVGAAAPEAPMIFLFLSFFVGDNG
jgi:hypothetical protein